MGDAPVIHPHDALRAHLLEGLGLGDPRRVPPLPELAATEWSPAFERLMRNRLLMGAIRYGRLGEAGKPAFERIPDIIRRAKKYAEDGNLEHLVDLANLALCEYVEGRHPRRHFASADDGEHTKG
jgi:hypothetical protein